MGAMVVGNTDNINNKTMAGKIRSQLQRGLGKWSLSIGDRSGQRSIHGASAHVNIYSQTRQYNERRREGMWGQRERQTDRRADRQTHGETWRKIARNKDWWDKKQWGNSHNLHAPRHTHTRARTHTCTHTHTHTHAQPSVIMVTFAVCQWLCVAVW